jgi:hypothetical protein
MIIVREDASYGCELRYAVSVCSLECREQLLMINHRHCDASSDRAGWRYNFSVLRIPRLQTFAIGL